MKVLDFPLLCQSDCVNGEHADGESQKKRQSPLCGRPTQSETQVDSEKARENNLNRTEINFPLMFSK